MQHHNYYNEEDPPGDDAYIRVGGEDGTQELKQAQRGPAAAASRGI